MCGYAYFRLLDGSFNLSKLVNDTLNILKVRGPDEQNYYFNKHKNELFCHARLEIIGNSIEGKQPAISEDKLAVLLFNGAIYNYKKLIPDCETISDTNVLLQLLCESRQKALGKIDGMFSILFRNYDDKSLILARDLTGQKPLYYAILESASARIFCVSSDLRCITKNFSKGFDLKVNHDALGHYSNYGFVNHSETLIAGVNEVPPNSYLVFRDDMLLPAKENRIYTKDYPSLFLNSDGEHKILEKLDDTLKIAVCEHLEADQDVGVLLSGGIDSSLVASYASQLSLKNINAFTLSFGNKDFDESIEARFFAKYLGLNHDVLNFPDGYELVNLIEKVLGAIDHPFCDISSIPTFAICEYISNYNKVVLTGDGGDEMFAGYNRHIYQNKLAYKMFPEKFVSLFLPYFENQIPEQKLIKLRKAISVKKKNTSREKYEVLLAIGNLDPKPLKLGEIKKYFDNETLNLDFQTYLPQLVLKKVDRMSMANGIECRAPLLSNKIFKVSQKISYDQKVAGGSKHLLRLLHAQKFPKNSNLKKKGFSVSRLVFKDEKVIAWLKHFCEIHQNVNDEIVSSLFVHIENLNNNKLAKVDINDVWKNIVLLNWLKANNVSL